MGGAGCGDLAKPCTETGTRLTRLPRVTRSLQDVGVCGVRWGLQAALSKGRVSLCWVRTHQNHRKTQQQVPEGGSRDRDFTRVSSIHTVYMRVHAHTAHTPHVPHTGPPSVVSLLKLLSTIWTWLRHQSWTPQTWAPFEARVHLTGPWRPVPQGPGALRTHLGI